MSLIAYWGAFFKCILIPDLTWGTALSDLSFFPCYNTRKLDAFYFVVIFVLELMTFNESFLTAPAYAKVCKKKD